MRRMDELEININQRSIKVSYLFSTIFLVVWSLYDTINEDKLSLAGILVCINVLLLLISRFIFSKKYDFKNKTYVVIAVTTVFIIVAILLVGFFLNER